MIEGGEKRIKATPGIRPQLVADMAIMATVMGDLAKAQAYGEEALRESAHPGLYQADQVFCGNEALGLVAAKQGKLELARTYLLQAGRTKGNTTLGKFGPNMRLAKALLERGERDTVLEFIDLCRAFWPDGADTLTAWSDTIRAGGVPDFGRNLLPIQ
jgi:hypothetical protein